MVTRRAFLATLSHSAGGSALLSVASVPAAVTTYRSFDVLTGAFVAAACECIIPTTPSSPGAGIAGIAALLDSCLSSSWDHVANDLRGQGWAAGNALPRRATVLMPAAYCKTAAHAIQQRLGPNNAFETLSQSTQQRLLNELQHDPIDLNGVPSNDFIDLLLTLTVAAYLSHPKFGATRDLISWPLPVFPGAHATATQRRRTDVS